MSMIQGEVVAPEISSGDNLSAKSVDNFITLAIEKGVDAESLERLMAMRSAELERTANREFVAAMAAFQQDCPVIYRAKKVTGGTNHQYAPIEDIYHVTKPLEAKHGFTHWFDSDLRDDGVLIIACVVAHIGGHTHRTEFPVPPTQGVTTKAGAKLTNSAQDMGIMRTYGQRYAYESAFAITVAGQDMDGRVPDVSPPVSTEAASALRSRYQAAGGSKEADFLRALAGVETFDELTEDQAKNASMRIAEKERAR